MSAVDDLPRDETEGVIAIMLGLGWHITHRSGSRVTFNRDRLTPADMLEMYAAVCGMMPEHLYAGLFGPGALTSTPDPRPVRAKSFDDWLTRTSELLEECARRKQ